jgi:ankyrin repeat protein
VWPAHRATLSRPKLSCRNCGFFDAILECFLAEEAAMPHINHIALVFAFVIALFASAPQRTAAETSELMKAIEVNDVRWVRALIAAGANVKNDVRPLREAAIRGYVPIAKALIDGGAEVNGRGYPLNAAARAGQTEMVALLIRRGADVNARDLTGYTPLLEAVLSPNGLEAAKVLLAANADPAGEDEVYGGTALHWAAFEGKLAMAELLLAVGMDINAQTGANACWPGTPLHVAARSNQFAMVDYLIEHGAALNMRDKHGETPLAVALDPRVKALLIKAGATEPQ